MCREKTTGNVYAMKKLKKSEMLRRGQVEHVKAERNLLPEVEIDPGLSLVNPIRFKLI